MNDWNETTSGKLTAAAIEAALRYSGPVPSLKPYGSDLVTKDERAKLNETHRQLCKMDAQAEVVCASARARARKQRNRILIDESISGGRCRDLLSGDELHAEMADRHAALIRSIPEVRATAREIYVAISKRISTLGATKAREAIAAETEAHEDLGIPYQPSNIVKSWHKLGELGAGTADRLGTPHMDGTYRSSPPVASFFRDTAPGLLSFEPLTEKEIEGAIDELQIDTKHEGALVASKKKAAK